MRGFLARLLFAVCIAAGLGSEAGHADVLSAVGVIARFSASGAISRIVANNGVVAIGGINGVAQESLSPTAAVPIGIIGAEPVISGSGSEVRFAVAGLDRAPFDAADRNRAELYFPTVPFYAKSMWDFEFKLDGNGTVTDRGFLIPWQVHADDSLSPGGNPTIGLNIARVSGAEVLNVGTATGPSTASITNTTVGSRAFTRDAWHTFHIEVTPDRNEGYGAARVVMDGVELCNLVNVPMGYGTATALSYGKIGLYAGLPTQTADTGLVSHVRNATFSPAPQVGILGSGLWSDTATWSDTGTFSTI